MKKYFIVFVVLLLNIVVLLFTKDPKIFYLSGMITYFTIMISASLKPELIGRDDEKISFGDYLKNNLYIILAFIFLTLLIFH